VSTTTAARRGTPVHLHGITLEPGVDLHRTTGRVRVRLTFPSLGMHVETFPATPDGARAANRRINELRQWRAAGLTPDTAPRTLTLGVAAGELLDTKIVEGDLTAGGLAWWRRILRPWMEGEFAAVPVHLLNPSRVAAAHRARAAKHPKSAKDELGGLKATLRYARSEGCAIPDRLLDVKPPKLRPRTRKVLTPAELDAFALAAPARYVRLLLLQGRVGCRISELLTLERWQVDPDGATITIPEPKERRPKVIPLLPDEVQLFREQLGELRVAESTATAHLPATPAGRSRLWVMPDGRDWPMVDGRVAGAYFDRAVWAPTLKAAGRSDFTSHDLRATAITIMYDRGISLDTCALRVGHKDAKLIKSVYYQGAAHERAARELAAYVAAERATAHAATTPRAAAAPLEG